MESERPTTRRLMLAVLVVALALGLGWPFVSSLHNPNWHLHTYVLQTPSGKFSTIPQGTREPILAQYWRRLTGRDPREIRHCGASWGEVEEVCALQHPEIVIGGGSRKFQPLPRQIEFADRMNARVERKRALNDSAAQMPPPAGKGNP